MTLPNGNARIVENFLKRHPTDLIRHMPELFILIPGRTSRQGTALNEGKYTVYRMDDVPISLRPAFDSPYPSDLEVLQKIEKRVKELIGARLVN